MRKVIGYIETARSGSRCTFEFEVDDDATNEEIQELAKDRAFEDVNWDFQVDGEYLE
jgi:hypothetical protein